MASIVTKNGGRFYLRFRYDGQRFFRALEVDSVKEAHEEKSRVEKALRLLKDGTLTLGAEVSAEDLWRFLRSGGRAASLPKLAETKPLGVVFDDYFDSFPEGAKEANTLATEQIHKRHFIRLIGKGANFADIGAAELAAYVKARQKEDGLRGRKVGAETIKKELATFSQLWGFARGRGYVSGINPAGETRRPQSEEKLPFMTFKEIAKKIKQPGLSKGQIADLWGCLFLDETEVAAMLTHVRNYAESDPAGAYVYPMLALVAYTGCRRSEMMRSEVDDVRFDDGVIRMREKKKSRKLSLTYREVDLHPKLRPILKTWLAGREHGPTITSNGESFLTPKETDGAFKRALRGSKWKVVEGFHVLRHSFASNCARRGIAQSTIDSWLGHTTEEMRKRYRHLFPAEKRAAIALVFSGE